MYIRLFTAPQPNIADEILNLFLEVRRQYLATVLFVWQAL